VGCDKLLFHEGCVSYAVNFSLSFRVSGHLIKFDIMSTLQKA
jgi:hypothetical protein